VKLDYHVLKSIANAFFGAFVGRKTRPTFFNIKDAYPGLDHVTRAYPAIRSEFVIARHTYGRSVVRKAEAFAGARGAKRQIAA
jgi:hypothetical protein